MKVFVVIKTVDEQDTIVGVCSTYEIADAFRITLEANSDIVCNISREDWEKMWDKFFIEDIDNNFPSVAEGIHTLFPKYSIEDILKAEQTYDTLLDEIRIEEIDFYDNINMINCGTNL